MSKVKYISKTDVTKALSKEVKEHYELNELPKVQSIHFIHGKWGRINFGTITIKRVEQLVNEGCPIFKEKTSSSDSE